MAWDVLWWFEVVCGDFCGSRLIFFYFPSFKHRNCCDVDVSNQKLGDLFACNISMFRVCLLIRCMEESMYRWMDE